MRVAALISFGATFFRKKRKQRFSFSCSHDSQWSWICFGFWIHGNKPGDLITEFIGDAVGLVQFRNNHGQQIVQPVLLHQCPVNGTFQKPESPPGILFQNDPEHLHFIVETRIDSIN